jgi:hypothetical protein
MTDTIICTPIRQPSAFSNSNTGFSVAAVLNFDCRLVPHETPQTAPKSRFKTFLHALPKVTFRVYQLPSLLPPQPTPPGTWPFEPADWTVSWNVPSGATPADNILGWLDRRGVDPMHPANPAPPDYWQPASTNANATLKLIDLKATHFLGSATTWPAPLPQDAGLVRLVTLTPTTDPPKDQRLVIIPFFDGASPNFEPKNFLQNNGIINFTYDAGYDFPDGALAEIRLIDDQLPDVTSLVDTSNGFLLAPANSVAAQDADRVAAILQRIENRSASLFWALPPIQAVTWPPGDENISRLVWRAMNGLATLLDPALMSLILPPPSPNAPDQKGPFIAALAVCVDRAVTGNSVSTAGIATFVRDGLKKKLLLLPNDESNDQRRKDLVDLLAGLFKIDITKQDIATATGILPLLLLAYRKDAPDQLTKPNWFDEPKNKRFKPYEATLSNELGALAQKLQTEGGIESLVRALFEAIGLFDDLGLADCTDPKIGVDTANSAIAMFRALLNQNFNGLDAARHAVARLYELHLVAAASASQPAGWAADDLANAVTGTRWFAQRIEPRVNGTLNNIGSALPIYATKALSDGDRAILFRLPPATKDEPLDTAFEQVSNELLATGAARRFLPDSAPGKLRIQIAVDSDATDFENFIHTYNGIGVLVRQVGDAKWAYGNLAELDLYNMYDGKDDQYQPVVDPNPPGDRLITLLPLQPAAIDGQCRLFLEFDGQPFTDRSFSETSAAGNASDANQAPFYQFKAPSQPDLSTASFALTPALAYGKSYEAAAFVVGKGGALPPGVRNTTPSPPPWLPVNAPQVPTSTGSKVYSRSFLYQRTTAIGRTNLNELPQPGIAKRIGVGIDGVQPLFRDHPRVGLSSVNGSAVLDVLRNADGTGAFGLPKPPETPPTSPVPEAGETVSISLENAWWWGSAGMLTLSFFNQPGPRPENAAGRQPNDDDPLIGPIDILVTGSVADAALLIEITSTQNSIQYAQGTVSLTFLVKFAGTTVTPPSKTVSTSIKSVWARVKIAATNFSKTASLSFADPTVNLAGPYVTSHPTTDSLLLIAPAGASEWRVPYTKEVTADIILPRVGFVDLDRWLWNDSLFSDAATPDRTRPPTQAELTNLHDFYKSTLMAAYIGRHADQNLPALLERLPDLAVDKLLVELTPLDALFDDPARVTSHPPYPDPTFSISQVVKLRTLGKRLQAPAVQGNPDPASKLLNLSDGCTARLQIGSDDSGALSITFDSNSDERDATITINVPRGVVARLTIRPMVPRRHIEGGSSISDPRMATLATEIRGDHYILEGTSLVIESMLGALASRSPAAWQDQLQADKRCHSWEDLVATAVTVKSVGAHRSYDLVARLSEIETTANAWRWRQLANIDVDTQRWRFTGRPIYSWLEPSDGSSSDVAIEQKWGNNSANRDDIIAFEKESFFNRDDADADTQTMRLNPAGDTVLQSFPWEQPSATYFRHRLTIRSRYEGALASGQVAAQRVWGEDIVTDGKGLKSAARSWIRVAMLADRTRLQLTRPQLRALIPLTRAPDNSAAAPPVMAILDERPFAHGGLADRIAAEIRTGLGYVLPPAPQTLQILDSRKEFGPDPRLTYTPTPEEVAPAITLREEGPVGLTFDSDSVRNPLFVNTALILHPVLMMGNGAGAGTLEEHFLSVGLRRYLDTTWLVGGTSPTTTQAIAEPLWIGPVGDPNFTLGADTASNPLITLSDNNGVWIVKFDSRQIDPPSACQGRAASGAAAC